MARLRNEVQEMVGQTVAESSRRIYDTNLGTYKKVMATELQVPPEPIDVDKMQIFILWMKHKGRTYNTLVGYARSFSFHFRLNNLEPLTQTVAFKMFLSGLRRGMLKDGREPNAKAPFPVEWFDRILEIVDLDDVENRTMMFFMALCFHGFLRISELLNLRKSDIRVDEVEEKIELFVNEELEQDEITFSELWKSDNTLKGNSHSYSKREGLRIHGTIGMY